MNPSAIGEEPAGYEVVGLVDDTRMSACDIAESR